MNKLLLLCAIVLLASCVTTKQIGSTVMISNRNLESSVNYVLIKTYMGAGDKVKWTKLFKNYTGTIVDLKNDKACTIKRDSDSNITEVDYTDLTKIGKQ